MPEFRQNLATKEWTIIATERAKRPEDFKAERTRSTPPERSPQCPFCPGNEKMTLAPKSVLGKADDWRVRVIPNKFPALVAGAAPIRDKRGAFRSLPGEGVHEVIIESPSHARHPALLDRQAMRDLLSVYRDRFKVLQSDDRIALTLLFKNHGETAGTSLEHPHSQLIGSSVVPAGIRHRMDEAEKYYEQTGACVFCEMVAEEASQKERIVVDSPRFAAFVLFAALSPFHIWILPKRHCSSFAEIDVEELDDLASTLQSVLKKVYKGLDNPDYNYVIQSAPQDRGETAPFHWYLSLVVRLSKTAGFELGSGMFLNTALPEESAKFLRGVNV